MKKIENISKISFFKKIFIKICRFFGYEIIDQSNFSVPTQKKQMNEQLSVQGKKSITLPLGETKITRKVNDLSIIFRSCTKVNMLTQNKKRLFEKDKSEYTFRSLNSLVISSKKALVSCPNVKINIIVIDHDSSSSDRDQIQSQLKKSGLNYSFIPLDVNEFISKINKLNSKNENVSKNQISNMCNIYKSFLIANERCSDLIYFVEDDYIHKHEGIGEMILTYERISSQINKELILCPIDYPYLYSKMDSTNIFLGDKMHWRSVDETLCTFLTSKIILKKYWEKLTSMCLFEHYPFEQPLHEIYKTEYCFSPVPSLAFHCTNINSIFGLSPFLDWKKIWDENENY